MSRLRQQLYGWYDEKAREFRLSRYPADAPVRPSVALASKDECDAIAERKRAKILWWPPLPEKFNAELPC